MNEKMDRIDEFALQSQKEYGDFDGSITALDYRKFAELIIKECANISLSLSHRSDDMGAIIGTRIKQHFGIE